MTISSLHLAFVAMIFDLGDLSRIGAWHKHNWRLRVLRVVNIVSVAHESETKASDTDTRFVVFYFCTGGFGARSLD